MIKLFKNALSTLIELMEEKDITELRYFLDFEFEIEVLDLNMKRVDNYTGCKIKLFPVIENGKLVMCQCNDSDEVCQKIVDDIKRDLVRGLLTSMHLDKESNDNIYRNAEVLKSNLYIKLSHTSKLNLNKTQNARISNYVFKKYMPNILLTA